MLQSLPFYHCHAPPPKKAEADFLLMKAIWLRNSLRHNFFLLRLKLHWDVVVQILSLCSFRIALCLASALLTQGFLVSVSQCGFQDSYYMFSFFSPGNTYWEKKKTFKCIFPSAIRQGWLRPLRTIGGNLGRLGVFKRMKAARKHHYLVITSAFFYYLNTKTSTLEKLYSLYSLIQK